MSYTIRFAESAAKALSKMDKGIRCRIEAKIETLATDPFPHGVRKIVGEGNAYRIRVGDYRVVYGSMVRYCLFSFCVSVIAVISTVNHRSFRRG